MAASAETRPAPAPTPPAAEQGYQSLVSFSYGGTEFSEHIPASESSPASAKPSVSEADKKAARQARFGPIPECKPLATPPADLASLLQEQPVLRPSPRTDPAPLILPAQRQATLTRVASAVQQLSQSANPAQVQALHKFRQLHTGAYTYQLQPSPVLEVLMEAVDAGILQGIKCLALVQRRPA